MLGINPDSPSTAPLTIATNVTALLLPIVWVAQARMERMNLTAASPLLATRTLRWQRQG